MSKKFNIDDSNFKYGVLDRDGSLRGIGGGYDSAILASFEAAYNEAEERTQNDAGSRGDGPYTVVMLTPVATFGKKRPPADVQFLPAYDQIPTDERKFLSAGQANAVTFPTVN